MTDAINSHSRRMYNAQKKTRASLEAIASPSIATPRTDPRVVALVDALFFYGTHALGCRMVHREGDTHRQALHDDGGERARAAIAAIEERQTNE